MTFRLPPLFVCAIHARPIDTGDTTGMGQYPELEYGRKMSRTWSPVTHVITGLFRSMKGRLFCVYCLPIPVENELTYHEAGNKQEMARKVNILPAYHDSW